MALDRQSSGDARTPARTPARNADRNPARTPAPVTAAAEVEAAAAASLFTELLPVLVGARKPTVWSLLVTVFGELAQEPEARISGALLGRIADLIGVRPEATRVALHRLRKDGWIDSRRRGRTSEYFLTPWGREQSAAATPRIYAEHPPAAEAWLVLTDPGRPAGPQGESGTWISASMMLVAQKPAPEDIFATRLHPAPGERPPLPEWMTMRVCDPALAALSVDLADRLSAAHDLLAKGGSCLSGPEVAALRVLIVHGWRRIVLKAPMLPDEVFPGGWQGAACRQLVSALLEALPRQTLSGLEEHIAA